MSIPDGATYSTLRIEFESNMLYSPAYTNGDNNTVTILANGIASPQYPMDVTKVDARLVQSGVVKAEFDILTDPERDNWRDLLTTSLQEGFVVRDAGYRAQVVAIWQGKGAPGEDATLIAFAALQKRDATEFEAFWDNLAFVFESLACTLQDVRNARQAP